MNDEFLKAMQPIRLGLESLERGGSAPGPSHRLSRRLQRLLSLNRYWRYSDRLYDLYVWSIKDKAPIDGKSPNEVISELAVGFLGDPGLFRSYWYGALHVVVEGYQRLGIHDAEVDAMLTGAGATKLGQLREARNATFHFQPQMASPKLWRFLSIENVPWTIELQEGLGRAIMTELGPLLDTDSSDAPPSATGG